MVVQDPAKQQGADFYHHSPDGMYYEITYNGDKGEMYLDAYKKMHNECIKIKED